MGNRSTLLITDASEQKTIARYVGNNWLPRVWFVLFPESRTLPPEELFPERKLSLDRERFPLRVSCALARERLARLESFAAAWELGAVSRAAIRELQEGLCQPDSATVLLDPTEYLAFGGTAADTVRALPAWWEWTMRGLETRSIERQTLADLRSSLISGSSVTDVLGFWDVADGESADTPWTPTRIRAEDAAHSIEMALLEHATSAPAMPIWSEMTNAIEQYRKLAKADPDHYLPRLASTLDFAARLGHVGTKEEADRLFAAEMTSPVRSGIWALARAELGLAVHMSAEISENRELSPRPFFGEALAAWKQVARRASNEDVAAIFPAGLPPRLLLFAHLTVSAILADRVSDLAELDFDFHESAATLPARLIAHAFFAIRDTLVHPGLETSTAIAERFRVLDAEVNAQTPGAKKEDVMLGGICLVNYVGLALDQLQENPRNSRERAEKALAVYRKLMNKRALWDTPWEETTPMALLLRLADAAIQRLLENTGHEPTAKATPA